MKRALMAAVLSALVTAAVLATVGFGAASKSKSSSGKSSSGKTNSTSTSGPPPTMKEALAADEKRRAERKAKLAKTLGVTTEKLTAAQDALKKKRLDEAVTNKQLTEAQRDAIVACETALLTCDRSNLPAYGFGGRGHHGGPGHFGGRGIGGADFAKELATELGISEDKVTSALEANRPQRGYRGKGRGGHGHGGPGSGFGPPPGMDGASGTNAEPEPARSA